jgi:hypothetical protein
VGTEIQYYGGVKYQSYYSVIDPLNTIKVQFSASVDDSARTIDLIIGSEPYATTNYSKINYTQVTIVASYTQKQIAVYCLEQSITKTSSNCTIIYKIYPSNPDGRLLRSNLLLTAQTNKIIYPI